MEDFETQSADIRSRLNSARQNTQYQAPQGRMAGRIYVAPNALEYLAAGLRSAGAGRDAQMATGELQDLQGKRQTAIADALRGFGEKSQGAPAFEAAGPAQQGAPMADPLGLDGGQAASGGGYTVPERKPDLRGAYADLMAAPDASLRNAGMQGMIQMPQFEAAKLEKQEARQFRMDEAAAARQARMDELKMRAEDQRASQQERLAAQKEMRQMQMDFQRQNQQLIAANRPAPQAQIIQTDAGPMQFINGQAVPIMGPGGVPVKGKVGPEKEPTEGERKAGTLLQRLRGSQEQLSTVLEKNPSAASPNFVGQALSGIGAESLGNLATSADRQRVNAAQLDMLDAALTLGTGAAYTKEQLEGYRKSYFPQIGDSAATIADKQARLKNVISAAELAAGRTADKAVPKSAAAPAMTFDAAKESRYQQWLKSQGR